MSTKFPLGRTVAAITLASTSIVMAQNPTNKNPDTRNPNTPPANTADRDAKRDSGRDRATHDTADQRAALSLQRASKVLGLAVDSEEGEKIGKIDNLAIDMNSGNVHYAIISTGGLLGVGDRLTAVPFTALKFSGINDNAKLNVSKTRFTEAADFNNDGWATIGDRGWGTKVYNYYSVQPYWDRTWKDTDTRTDTDNDGDRQSRKGADNNRDVEPGASATLNLIKASDAIGMDVRNPQRENLGDIDDLVIDTTRGQIAYAVVSFGGVMGIGDKLFAVPFQSLKADRADEVLVLNVNKETLKNAPGFDKRNWPDMADNAYSKQVYSYYQAEPDWVYGYAAPGDTSRGDRKDNADKQDNDGTRLGGWESSGEYGRLLQGKSTETISGRVTSVDTNFKPGKSMSQGVQLGVQTDDGKTVNVHLGPAWYLNHQQTTFKEGDQVQITAAKAKWNGADACIAYKVRRDGKVMVLRHNDGSPMWDAWQNDGGAAAADKKR